MSAQEGIFYEESFIVYRPHRQATEKDDIVLWYSGRKALDISQLPPNLPNPQTLPPPPPPPAPRLQPQVLPHPSPAPPPLHTVQVSDEIVVAVSGNNVCSLITLSFQSESVRVF
ncbi:hypothetical protein AA313_de0206713 [Arthrobotrys entomopaga]|nr:hypothetical protein AA313_de0206713 [Arthrobotrys entomopaga]